MADNHDHSSHDHGHGDSHGHGHGDVPGVIPEGSWQDKLLIALAAAALVGMLWAGWQASQGIPCPLEGEGHHTAEATSGDPVHGAPAGEDTGSPGANGEGGDQQHAGSNEGGKDGNPETLKPHEMPPDVDSTHKADH